MNHLWEQVNAQPLKRFRFWFGALLFVATARFWWNGWIEQVFFRPTFFFRYFGWEWVPVPDRFATYLLFVLMAVSALGIAAGVLYRWSVLVFLVAFSWVELADVSNYLNHYYLVSCMLIWMLFIPLDTTSSTLGRWAHWALRLQVGVVYTYAAVAKAQSDWLFLAEPMRTWLGSKTDVPVLGRLFAESWAPLAMSWAGFLYDASIPWLLMQPRTKKLAYVLVVVFHGLTSQLFPIGMFPWIMMVCSLVFLDSGTPSEHPMHQPNASVKWAMVAFACFQVLFPLRAFLYPGNVLWEEQGMRFSWRVMVREKNASVVYKMLGTKDGKRVEKELAPHHYLTPHQEREFATQPDMILQLAHHLGKLKSQEFGAVEIRAEAWASLNGRKMARLIDPNVDLLQIKDGFMPYTWTVRLPTP